MDLVRDEFVVRYDASQATEADLIAVIEEQGFPARVVSAAEAVEDPPPVGEAAVETPAFFREALARARREQRPIVLDFSASWCVPCQRMHRETFPDPKVARQISN